MHFIMRKKPDLCKKKEFPSDIRKVNCEQCVVISMYDENRKFTKLVMFMAEKYYSNNLELNDAVSAFEDAIETWVLADVKPVENVWYYDHPNGAVIWVKDVSPLDEMQDERLRYGY